MSTVTNQIEETPAPAPEQARFSLNDLKGLQEIVKVAAERGAFRANELSAVGAVYDRLTAFLAAGEAASQPDETPEETPAATDAAEPAGDETTGE